MYVIGSAARCGCKAVGYSYMWYPGTTCAARRGEGILPHYWYHTGGVWCAHPLSLTVTAILLTVEASRIKSISGEIKGRYTYLSPVLPPK
jgi:hypothetical protein